MSLLFDMLSRFLIAFLPRNRHLLISRLQSLSAVILEPKKMKSVTVCITSPSICHDTMGLDVMIFIFQMLSFKPAFSLSFHFHQDFPGGSDSKLSAYNAGDQSSVPESGGSPGEGNGTPLQYFCLENPLDGGAWQATVHGVAKSWTRLRDVTFSFHFSFRVYKALSKMMQLANGQRTWRTISLKSMYRCQ